MRAQAVERFQEFRGPALRFCLAEREDIVLVEKTNEVTHVSEEFNLS